MIAAMVRRLLREPRVRGLLLGGVVLLLALHDLGDAAIVHNDEAREVGIVQDIVAGHWLWPRFNDDLLPDKPTLFHWLAAVPCALFLAYLFYLAFERRFVAGRQPAPRLKAHALPSKS